MEARDNHKRNCGITSSSGGGIYSPPMEASFLPCLHSSCKSITALPSSSFSPSMAFPCGLWPLLARHCLLQMQRPRIQRWCSCWSHENCIWRWWRENYSCGEKTLLKLSCSVTNGVNKVTFPTVPFPVSSTLILQLLPESATSLAGDLSPVLWLAWSSIWIASLSRT